MTPPSKFSSFISSASLFLFGAVFAGIGLHHLAAFFKDETTFADNPSAIIGPALFALVGTGIIVFGIYTFAHSAKVRALAAKHPGQPWMLKKGWAAGRIKDSNLTGLLAVGGMAVIWNGLSWTTLLVMLQKGEFAKNTAALLVLLFPLVGLVLAAIAAYQLLRWRKYGRSVFEMAEMPGVIGGSLGGLILTKARFAKGDKPSLRLRSIHRQTSGSGKNRTTRTRTLWEREQLMPQTLASHTKLTAVPVLFTIPYDCQPTFKKDASNEYFWELTLSAKTRGIDYKASFTVPVFKTEKSSAHVTGSLDQLHASEADAFGTAIDEIPGLRISQTLSGGEQWGFSIPKGNLITFFFSVLFVVVLLPLTAFLWHKGAFLLFPLLSLFFGLIAGYNMIVALNCVARITLHRDRIEVRNRLFGIPRAPLVLRRDQIDNMSVASGYASGQMRQYALHIKTRGGKNHRLRLPISNEIQAKLLAKHLATPTTQP